MASATRRMLSFLMLASTSSRMSRPLASMRLRASSTPRHHGNATVATRHF
jgi:hypothetical protein